METMCTIVFCWFSCVSIREEILFFLCLISLVVAVPVNHFSAEPRKGRRLYFFLPDGGMGFLSNDGCIWSMLLADENTGLYAMNRLCKLSNLTWRGCNGSMASSGWFLSLEIISRTMFFCLLNMCIGLFSVPRLMCAEMIHECLVGYAARIGWNSTDSIFSPCAKVCRRRNLKQKSNCECCASLFTVFVCTVCL